MARRDVTPKTIADRIRRGEGQKTEFKESLQLEEEIIRSLGAFVHADGGLVLVGVRDDRTVAGVSIGRNTLENLANRVANRTQPPLHPRIEALEIHGRTVVVLGVEPCGPDEVVLACGVALIRVGRTNQPMTPAEIRRRHFVGFKAENVPVPHDAKDESWNAREKRRIETYERNRGLFLSHQWRPSEDPKQVVDIVLTVKQHPGPDEPLTNGHVKSVEWHLGPKFFDRTIVKTEMSDGFRLEVSAYGPLLCLARVNFDDGHEALDLERYVDF